MLLLLKHHIVTHTHSDCGLCWWRYLQYLQYPHWSVQCGAVHRPAVAVVSVSSKHCPWQHQHQPPHETPANGHCMCQLCMCSSVDMWIYHCSPSVLYNTRIMCVTKHLTFLVLKMIIRSARGQGFYSCFTPLINNMVRSGHTSVRCCYIYYVTYAVGPRMFIIGGAAWFYTSPAPSVRSVIIIIPSPSVNILRRQYLQMYFLYSVFTVME